MHWSVTKGKEKEKPNEANRQRAEDSNSDLVIEDLGSETDKLCFRNKER